MRIWLFSLLLTLLLLPACGDGTRVVDLVVEQEVSIDFEAVLAGVAEEVVVPFDDLRDEPSYVTFRPELSCVALDRVASAIEITALEGVVTLPLQLTVEVSAPGSGSWVTLATYEGDVQLGTRLQFDDERLNLNPGGVTFLMVTTLSESPVYDVHVIGTPGADASKLEVDLRLEFDFSSDLHGCDS